MKQNLLAISLILICLCSCHQIEEVSAIYDINVNMRGKGNEFFEKYEYTILECDSVLISEIEKVEVSDKYIMVLSNDIVTVFDHNGLDTFKKMGLKETDNPVVFFHKLNNE